MLFRTVKQPDGIMKVNIKLKSNNVFRPLYSELLQVV